MRLLLPLFMMTASLVSAPGAFERRPLDLGSDASNRWHVRLPNGFRAVVTRDASSQFTAVHLRVLTGSVHEEGWYGYGLSHFFEHSLFLGSEGRPRKDQFSAEIESYGGANVNAYTTYDHTAYHFTVRSEHTRKGLECMEDLVFHPLFPEAEVRNEMGSILGEMDMRADQLESAFHEFFMRTSFRIHPVRFPVIGFKDRFRTLTREQLLEYYRKRYVPGNMILSVAGNVNPTETLRWIEKIFGSHAPGGSPEFVFAEEPPFETEVHETTHPKARAGRMSLAWRSVSYFDPDMYPLDVLSTFLAGGKGTILHESLKEKRGWVESVGSSSWTPRQEGLFEISAVLPVLGSGKELKERVDAVEKEVLGALERISRGEIEAWRIESVKREVLSGFLQSRETVMGLASKMANSVHTSGGLNYDEIYLRGVQSVTSADVARVAKKVLLDRPRHKVVLVPPVFASSGFLWERTRKENLAAEVPVTILQGVRLPEVAGTTGRAIGIAEALKTLPPSETAPARPRTEKIVLSNGLTVLFHPSSRHPTVHAVWASAGGLAYESKDEENGAYALLSKLFLAGSDLVSREDLLRRARENGIDVDGFAGKNAFGLRMDVMRDRIAEGADLFSRMIRGAEIAEADFQVERKTQRFSIETRRENAWATSTQHFRRLFFANTPYARMEDGSLESLDAMRVGDLRALKRKRLVAANSVVGIYGDVTREEWELHFRPWLEKIPSGERAAKGRFSFPELAVSPAPDVYRDVMPGTKQTYVRMAFRSPAFDSPDQAAFQLLSGHLSGMGGPLFKLRSEPMPGETGAGGRAYRLGCFYDNGPDYGALVFYAELRHEARKDVGWAVNSFRREVDRIVASEITAADLARARNAVLGAELQADERLGHRSAEETLRELYGLGFESHRAHLDALERVDAKAIRDSAKRHLGEGRFLVHSLVPEESP